MPMIQLPALSLEAFAPMLLSAVRRILAERHLRGHRTKEVSPSGLTISPELRPVQLWAGLDLYGLFPRGNSHSATWSGNPTCFWRRRGTIIGRVLRSPDSYPPTTRAIPWIQKIPMDILRYSHTSSLHG
ncbi:hypothetical protein I7I50_01692 [Histoplasma capsulatum G186AR]|nr:hypothetical protein I7I52_11908 [Histoplasma capsulatum]QSS71004.1 hypothetical protein I7I50_01692 [Histoplasma capsulatum G186AR]